VLQECYRHEIILNVFGKRYELTRYTEVRVLTKWPGKSDRNADSSSSKCVQCGEPVRITFIPFNSRPKDDVTPPLPSKVNVRTVAYGSYQDDKMV
jgi:hypothetical protein